MGVGKTMIEYSDIRSFKDLLHVMKGGERLIVAAPSLPVASQIFRSLSAEGMQAGKLATMPPISARTVADAVANAKRHIGKMDQQTRLLVDLTPPGTPWTRKSEHRLEFYFLFSPSVIKKQIRSVWIVAIDQVSEAGVAALKDDADFFLDVTDAGSVLIAQLIAARRLYGPGLFFPRRMRISDDGISFDDPVLPGLVEKKVVGSSTPEIRIADLLQEPYRRAFLTSVDAMVIFDLKGEYREFNRRACDFFGYSSNEIRTRGFSDFIPESSRWRTLRALVELRQKVKDTFDVEVKRKSGKGVQVEVVVTPVGDGRFLALIKDVTRNRKIEHELRSTEERYRSLVSASPYPQAMFVNRHLVESNKAFRDRFPWACTEGDHATSFAEFFGKQNAATVKEAVRLTSDQPEPAAILKQEARITSPDGAVGEFEVTFAPTRSGSGKGVFCTFVEVTARAAAVRESHEAENKYRALLEQRSGAVTVVRSGEFVYVNRGFVDFLGYSSTTDLTGKQVSTTVASKEKKRVLEGFVTGAVGDAIKHFEFTAQHKDGTHRSVEVFAETIEYAGAPSLLCFYHDITERKRVEEEIQRKGKEQQIIEHLSRASRQSLEPVEVMKAGLEAAMHWLGYEGGGVYRIDETGAGLVLAIHQGLPEKIAATLGVQSTQEGVTGYVTRTMEPLFITVAEYPPFLPYKSLFETEKIQHAAYLPLTAREKVFGVMLLCTTKSAEAVVHDPLLLGPVAGFFGSAMDNALAYESVRVLEERYHSAIDHVTDVIYECNPNGSFVFIGPQVERLLGHKPQEFVQNPDLWRSILHPDDRAGYSRRISSQVEGGETVELQYRMLPKGKAAYLWVRDSVRFRRDASGSVTGMLGIVTDITSQMDAQQEVLGARELRGDVLESLQEGVVVFDPELRCIDWNPAMEEIIGREGLDGPTPRIAQTHQALIRRALAGEVSGSDDMTFKRAGDKDEKWLSGQFSPLRNHAGETIGVVGILTDVTHRKLLEQEVRESEETLRNVFDAMGDALMITDLQGRVREVNKGFAFITGYSRSEVLGTSFPYPWLIEDEMPKFVMWIKALREKRYLRDFDMTWKRKDGVDIAISLNTTLLRTAMGEPVAMLNLARDISERKQLSNELAAKNLQIEMLNRIISRANTTVDFARIFDEISDEIMKVVPCDQITVGLLTEDRTGMVLHACVGPTPSLAAVGSVVPLDHTVSRFAIARGQAVVIGDLKEQMSAGQNIISVAEGLRSQISIPIVLNERILGTLNVASLQRDAFTGDELSILQPIADQIGAMVDRTQLFQRVSNDSKYIHNLLNSIDSVVLTVDRSSKVREVNEAWRAFATLGRLHQFADEGSVIGRRLDEILGVPDLLGDLAEVMPRLFEQVQSDYAREFTMEHDGAQRTFQLVANPMVINGLVTELVFTLTDITGVKKTEAEIKRRNSELVALNAIATSISKSLNLDEVLHVAAEQLKGIFGADLVLCYLRNEQKKQLVLSRSIGLPATLASGISMLDIGSSAVGSVVSDRRPLIIGSRLQEDARVTPSGRGVFTDLALQSMVVGPLQSKETVLGAMVAAFKEERTFTVQEQNFLMLIGNQLGPAIENAQLYTRLQDQVQVMTSLYELGKGLSGALDTRSLLEVVHREIVKSIPIDLFVYDTYSEVKDAFEQVFDVVDSRWETGVAGFSTDGIKRDVMKSGRAYLGTPLEDRSLILVPVNSKQKVIGILSIGRLRPETFSEDHLRLVQSIANLTGLALDRAILFEDTVAKSNEIEHRNKELDDFTYVVSHDLKEPLITIEGYSKIVLKEYRDAVDEEGRGYLSSVVQSSARMKNLIDDLLTLSRVGRVAEMMQPVSIGKVLGDVVRDFEFTLREKNASINVPERLPTVKYNPTQLSMIFRNLISNAIKFNARPDPRIDIGVEDGPGEYTFTVADNGIGIEKQHFDKIFVIFQRLHRSEEYQGTGAGLTIVKKIVEIHRGRIWVESELGKGTTFYFTIPK